MINQSFFVQATVQFRFPGGALDADLFDESAAFPVDESGTPTFRPSAAWFMIQIDFNNANEHEMVDTSTGSNPVGLCI